ncbi:polysaccharide biosynthesis protein [Bacteroidota bacterium]
MKHFLIRYLSRQFVPRWIIFLFDIGIVYMSLWMAYIIRHNFEINLINFNDIFNQTVSVIPLYIISFLIFKPFAGVIRHSGRKDLLLISISLVLIFIAEIFVNIIGIEFNFPNLFIIPKSVIVIHLLLSITLLSGSRVIIRYIYGHIVKKSIFKSTNVLIYGVGRNGIAVLNTLRNDIDTNYDILAFIDNNPKKQNKQIEGIPVYSFDKAKSIFLPQQRNNNIGGLSEENKIDEIIFAIHNITKKEKRKCIDQCLEFDCEVHSIVPGSEWQNGNLHRKHINKIEIEDLLGRDAIHLDEQNIMKGIKNKNILVTGAAGSIGSEIIRQLIRFKANSLILVDQAENQMFYLKQELFTTKNVPEFHFIIADVRDKCRMKNIFELYKPDIVFHAAAYKHVPLMEDSVYEAIRINIIGTKIIADLSLDYNAQKFVMISTDKAVNPTNIMGASKRIAEIYIQSLHNNNPDNTQFITTRFGNVLGSNGSVIPHFRRQIKHGGPITITHPDICRYFMTIPEACQLVLEAGFMGKGGEVFVFDMGEPIKIIDLAKKMIKLSGLSEDQIKIEISGLRPGEKLYEELLIDSENDLLTHNEKIMISKVPYNDYEQVNKSINMMEDLMKVDSEIELVKLMKKIVPEFISNNSIYSKLDKK